MKNTTKMRVLAMVLTIALVLGVCPMIAFAANDFDTSVSANYYNVISYDKYNLAAGAIEKEIVVNNADGSDRKVVHVFEVDTTNENIEVLPGYYGIDKLDPNNLALDGVADKAQYWQAKELTKTVKYYENMGYNVVGAMNTALAYDSNAPYGYMVMNGVVLGTPEVHKGAQTYLAIYKDGKCELRSMSTPLDGNEWTAISANFGWLVKDGVLTSKTVERTSSDASRSMIGIKADGTLVFCQVDGRNAPTSTGLSNYEMGEMMLSLGCVNAVNCDGGGSSTFVSKREGETENTMRSIPSDGAERPTINSVILVSKAKADGVFHHAVVDAAYDYIAPGASLAITATGVDSAGFPAEVPANISWQVSDAAMGTVSATGVLTAGNTVGQVTVQMVYEGSVVGEKLLNIVHPASFSFKEEETVIPYGRTAALELVATYGADNWDVCVDGAYSMTLSNAAAGSISGNMLTATTSETVTGVDVTVTYLADTSKTDVLKVTYGKGSEVIFDFEDGDRAGFVGFDEAKEYSIQNGINNTLVGSEPLGGQWSNEVDGCTSISDATKGGPVRNGKYALAWTLDNTNASFAGWTYNVLFNIGETVVLRDVANGMNATALGMWLYIPEGATGLAFQSQLYAKNANGTLTCKQAHFTFTTVSGVVKNLNSCTEADIPESRWVYASIDLTAYDYICTPVVTDTSNSRSPSFIRTYIKPMAPAVHTFYIDDITLDYSSAVDDRVLPTISNVSFATADTATTLANGMTINGNTMAFSANIADNAGLDYTTGKILVDGVEMSGVTASGKVMSCGDVTLTSGVHTVTFQIADKLGNVAKVTRTFTVAGDAVITLGGHNDSGKLAEYDSVYYIDINTTDLASIEKLTTVLKLQTANDWELDGVVAANGYKATCVYNEQNGLLTVTVERIGNSYGVAMAAEQTLVSIPVRVWSWDAIDHVTGKPITPETQFASGYCPIVTIDCAVVSGEVEFAEGAYTDYVASFGGKISVATNLNDTVNPWHVHDAELSVLNQDATCTVDGFTGRTYCASCGSVMDWGTIIPATGHSYVVDGDYIVCEKGDDVINTTGLVKVNGNIYYMIAGKLATGWQSLATDEWMYFNPTTKAATTGEFKVSGLTYTANEDGVVVKGAWVKDSKGTKYSYGPAFYKRVWKEIDGTTYYFGNDNYMYTGNRSIPVNRNNLKEGTQWYEFAENGALIRAIDDYTGFMTENGQMYYVVDGWNYYGGLMLVDGAYYYARTYGEIVTNKTYWITKTNDLLPVGNYTFGADGKMLNAPATEEPDVPDVPVVPEVKNGICADETGKLFYYVNDVKTYGGLMLIDGSYYYARSSGEIVCNRTYWTTKNNDLLPADNYSFGADGKMLNAPATEEPDVPDVPVVPEVKNGICADETGKLFYYVNDVKTYGGLMLIDGSYYYARSSGEIVCNRTYWTTKNNDLLPADNYSFGADGKMLNAPATEEPDVPDVPVVPEVKNGIVEEDGKLFYYVNDVKTYGGLMLIDGDYYYARSSGEIVCNRTYWITKNNDLLPVDNYTFDADGKMINPPVAE